MPPLAVEALAASATTRTAAARSRTFISPPEDEGAHSDSGARLHVTGEPAAVPQEGQHRLRVEVVGYPALPREIERFAPCCLSPEQGRGWERPDLDLEADRTSTHWMASNQLRLWFSAFALLLIQRLRTLALRGTQLANATAGTIRQRLLKIGAMVTVSTRRVYVRLASAFPLQDLFAQAHRALAALAPEDG